MLALLCTAVAAAAVRTPSGNDQIAGDRRDPAFELSVLETWSFNPPYHLLNRCTVAPSLKADISQCGASTETDGCPVDCTAPLLPRLFPFHPPLHPTWLHFE